MSIDELKFKESVLRECFKEKLAQLNVEGDNDVCNVKQIKMYGALWHYTYQLLLAEEHTEEENKQQESSAETLNIQATGLKMAGGKQ